MKLTGGEEAQKEREEEEAQDEVEEGPPNKRRAVTYRFKFAFKKVAEEIRLPNGDLDVQHDLIKYEVFKYLNELSILPLIKKRGFDSVQEKLVSAKSQKDKPKSRVVFHEITTKDADSETVLRALQSAPKRFKLFGAGMDLVEQTLHPMEPSSDSEGSSLSIKTPIGSSKETPPSSNDHDEAVDLQKAPIVAGAATSSSSK